jgi:hypothetical protein
MKRLHVHVSVPELDSSVRFYSTLFGANPTVLKHDYAKWMLEDPRVNFAISARGRKPGVDHLGVQVESDDELAVMRARIDAAETKSFHEGETQCCYAHSDKSWVTDPSGVAWEAYRTMGEVKTYYGDPLLDAACKASGSCGAATVPPAQQPERAVAACCG